MEDGEKEGEYSSRANHPTKGKEGCAEVQQLPHVETNLANAKNAILLLLENFTSSSCFFAW